MYHLPVRRGAGWSWGPRSVDKAWGVGVGVPSYGDAKNWDGQEMTNTIAKEAWPSSSRSEDLETGMQSRAERGPTMIGGEERHDRI